MKHWIQLAPEDAARLALLGRGAWEAVEAGGWPRQDGAALRAAATLTVTCGGERVVITGDALDVLPKLELFLLATLEEAGPGPAPRPAPEALFGGLLGRHNQVFVAARRHVVPEWARDTLSELVMEDVLVIRGPDGGEVLVSPDDEQPCALVVVPDWGLLPEPDAPVEYVRPLL